MSTQPDFRGRAKRVQILGVRQLTPEEVAAMWLETSPEPDRLKSLRDSHHRVAMCLAAGMTQVETAEKTGYSLTSIQYLRDSPAFRELVTTYSGQISAALIEDLTAYNRLALKNLIHAERQLGDQLEAADMAGQLPPIRDLVSVVADRADRFGYPKNQTNTNLNMNFGDLLTRRRERASGRRVRQPTIEHSTPALSHQPTSPSLPTSQPRDAAEGFLRRRF